VSFGGQGDRYGSVTVITIEIGPTADAIGTNVAEFEVVASAQQDLDHAIGYDSLNFS